MKHPDTPQMGTFFLEAVQRFSDEWARVIDDALFELVRRTFGDEVPTSRTDSYEYAQRKIAEGWLLAQFPIDQAGYVFGGDRTQHFFQFLPPDRPDRPRSMLVDDTRPWVCTRISSSGFQIATSWGRT